MSSASNDPEGAAPEDPLKWGESPELYLSYGTVSLAGRRPELTDAVAAERSFTVLSPPMGLDYFAVVDGRHLGAAVAERLPSRLGKAIAEQVEGELLSESPRFLAASRDDVAAWWRAAIEEAFRVVHEEVAGEGGAPVVPTALVALVMEKYFVVASSGGAKAVLCRGGEHVQLTPDPERMAQANKQEDENKSVEHAGGHVVDDSTSELDNVLQTTLASGSSSVPKPPPAVIPELDVVAVERKDRDEFLILASGELWGAVSTESACAFVRRRLGEKTSRIAVPWEAPPVDAGVSATLLARELAEKAVHAGSQGNVSVAIVLFSDFWAQFERAPTGDE
ncbi:putative protein phosphatase 2C 8 [Panicum miliaceum]|uniref:protein-serine/threonine phosphatase n=1 Tax=Panicum miliaceum TaxID=4540 RepID=A0A3L6QZF8_PANMI|nr:putative protein phosphatase 2C 8 [Panicum miliaceum]